MLYTTDGSAPVAGKSNPYLPGMTIPVDASETLQAIAVAPGYSASSVVSAKYTIALPPPSFTLSGASVTLLPGAATGNTSTISVTPIGGFTGAVALTAVVTSAPPGAKDLPTLSFGSTSPLTIASAGAATAILTISTTAPPVQRCRVTNTLG